MIFPFRRSIPIAFAVALRALMTAGGIHFTIGIGNQKSFSQPRANRFHIHILRFSRKKSVLSLENIGRPLHALSRIVDGRHPTGRGIPHH